MTVLLTDPALEQRLIEQRQAAGGDRYDEVWEGVYMMTPLPGDEHQELVFEFSMVLGLAIAKKGLGRVRPGVNLSDRAADWQYNYRAPDVAVFLQDGKAENHGTHWRGPADFLVEIVSPNDHTREKLPFYSSLGVVELLIVERNPWRLELYRHDGTELREVGRSELPGGEALASARLPLVFRLAAGEPRPVIEVVHAESGERWDV